MQKKQVLAICMITQNFLPKIGGLELVVHYLADELGLAGHSVTVLTRARNDVEQPSKSGNYDVVNWGLRSFLRKIPFLRDWGSNFSLAVLFLSLHGERKFDVIHAHSASVPASHGIFLARLTRLPVVITSHGEDVLVEKSTGYGLRLSASGDKRIQRNLRQANRLISVSEKVHKSLRAVVEPDTIEAIPNGVRLRRFSTPQSGLLDADGAVGGKPSVLMVGRNVPVKGFALGVDAFSRVSQKFPKAELVHVGRQGEPLALFAQKVGLQSHFHSLGELDHDEMPEVYSKAEVFLMPSYSEAASLALLEAMASGLACIITGGVGSKGIIQDGISGIIVSVGSVAEIEVALSNLLADPDKRREMGNAARIAVQSYDWGKIASRHEDLYRGLARGAIT